MVLHVSEHVLLHVGLCQQFLKMNVDPLKPNLPLKGCHVTLTYLGNLSIFMDVSQLHDYLLILQLFIPLIQVIYDPLSSLQFLGQCVDLSFLLLNGFSQL